MKLYKFKMNNLMENNSITTYDVKKECQINKEELVDTIIEFCNSVP